MNFGSLQLKERYDVKTFFVFLHISNNTWDAHTKVHKIAYNKSKPSKITVLLVIQ